MKVSPVSADLLIKLALGAALIGGAIYLVRKAGNVVGNAAAATADVVAGAAQAVNPLNQENVIYQTANKVIGGSEDRPLGVRIYDFFHPGE